MTKPVHVSLVMCTYGRTECIFRLIRSLEAQTCPDFEFIVVDQNPIGFLDEVMAAASQKLNVRYLRSERGASRARNVGIPYCKGKIIGFPDDDCWYPSDLIERLIGMFNHSPDTGVIAGRTLDEEGRESNGKFLKQSQVITRAKVLMAGTTNNALFARSDIANSILFNETLGVGSGTPFGAGEEPDFMLRALEKGVRIDFVHDLFTHHPQVDVVLDDKTLKRALLYSQGFGRVLQLHHYPLYYVFFRTTRSVMGACLGLVRGNLRLAKFKWIWAMGTIRGYFNLV